MDPNPSDEALMESYYRCDGRSLEILYERWGPRLEEFLRRQNFSKESAEDLCEETFVQVMKTKNRQVARYDPQKGRFCTWLWGIARNLWRDAWKRRGQRLPVFARHPTQAADPVRETPDATLSPEDKVEAEKLRDVVHECVKRLPERERWVVNLWMAMDGAKLQDMAEVLGTSVPTVHRLFWNAIRLIRACLEQKGVR